MLIKRHVLVLFVIGSIGTICTTALAQQDDRIVREDIEWLDVWVPDSNAHELPRVLLIGDSITRAYYPKVAELMKGKAYVARLATSKSVGDPALLAEISLVLSQNHFDVVHFNNGMHGWGYTEEEYAKHFPEFVDAIRKGAPGAKLIWATTTPVREKDDLEHFSERTQRVKARNQVAAEIVAKLNIPIDDLFTLVENHASFWAKDGVHFAAEGSSAQASQVAQKISEVMK